MIYTPEQIDQITHEKSKVLNRLIDIQMILTSQLAPTLQSERAREYLLHGICRRLTLLHQSIRNVFEIFPVTRENQLTQVELSNIEINLHAFTINIYGLLDNVAWVFVFENKLENNIQGSRRGVGLFSKYVIKHFPDRIKEYLHSDRIQQWYRDYAKNYRDALVHRIPLYVPPYNIDPKDAERYREYDSKISERMSVGDFDSIDELRKDRDSIGSISGAFLHSYLDQDAAKPVMFHAQMLADSNTVIEIIRVIVLNKETGSYLD
jgi:hypothetical protein